MADTQTDEEQTENRVLDCLFDAPVESNSHDITFL